MKVLVPGRNQRGWSTETVCTGHGNGGGGCGAKLLVEAADLYETARSFCGETDRFVTFKCEVCGVETDLRDPPGVAVKAAKANTAAKREARGDES